MVGRRGAVFAVLALLLTVALAGCTTRPNLPPVFRIDEVRYWFEDEGLVINVTFTNQANFTPGYETFDPYIGVYVDEYEDKLGGEGLQLRHVNFHSFRLSSAPATSITHSPWHDRWIPDYYTGKGYTGSEHVGKEFSPNKTIAAEFLFSPINEFKNYDGYYTFKIEIVSKYPNRLNPDNLFQDDAEYISPCFNRDIKPFYGTLRGKPDCLYLDCSGANTSDVVPGVETKPQPPPLCAKTKVLGPHE